MRQETEEKVREKVRERYGAAVSETGGSCCGSKKGSEKRPRQSSCCGSTEAPVKESCLPKDRVSAVAGYTDEQLKVVPTDAVANSFGCGNPLAFAQVKPGQTVLDIGSGAGIDCFIAADRVGVDGKVIGLDMTPEMINRARRNAEKGGYANVEFRQGEAENMPVDDTSVDWILSNCVINLSPNKPKVFAEAYRVLKPGGLLSISDIMVEDLPWLLRRSTSLYTSCVAGAIPESRYVEGLRQAGFEDVRVTERIVYDKEQILGFLKDSRIFGRMLAVAGRLLIDRVAGRVWSAKITARKPDSGDAKYLYRMAGVQDRQDVATLLKSSDLPSSDILEHLPAFIVARRQGSDQLAGCVGVEFYDGSRTALLRSLAVAPSSRGEGLGKELTNRVEEQARSRGVTDLYLLTTTASGFFAAQGYSPIDRSAAPSEVQSSREFAELCPRSAVLMTKKL